ncbi:MAG: hypothetical protein COA42_23745 [Alteromonadaceae bacterium]|nr:MAG: hypothetical protein COA42_23745 [Alteromonadaceae bacterium]
MSKGPNDIDQMLPSGEMLRSFMEQTQVTKRDLKNTLRSRGIFTYQGEKRDSIPLLISTILSPREFDELRAAQIVKIPTPKIDMQSMPWDSDSNLADSIPKDFDLKKVLDLEFSNLKINGTPTLTPVDGDPDKLKLDFNVEREDSSKSWANSKEVFPTSIEVSRNKEDGEVKLVVTHTANEAKDLAEIASTNIVEHFKKIGHVKEDNTPEFIAFNRFSHGKRIAYLLALSLNTPSELLAFDDVVELEFTPDKSQDLPSEMAWMETGLESLHLSGHSLHNSQFIAQDKFHPFVNIYRLDATFNFAIREVTGQCLVSFHFPAYTKSRDDEAELAINIKKITYDEPPKGMTKTVTKEEMLKDLDIQKSKQFKLYSDVAAIEKPEETEED